MVGGNEEGIMKVLEGNYAFISESAFAEFRVNTDCNLMTIGQPFLARDFALGFPLGSSLRKKVNLALLQLQKDEWLEDLKKKWWRKEATLCKVRHLHLQYLNLVATEISFAFFFYFP